jgi:hypothetical protein
VLLRSLKTALTEELNCKFNPASYRFFSSFCTNYRRAEKIEKSFGECSLSYLEDTFEIRPVRKSDVL